MVLIAAFSVALVATPLAMWLARRTGLLDHPGDLKVQSAAVPYLGGLGIASGVVVGAAATRPAFILPVAMALGLGVVDDARGVNPVVRLSAEVVIGITIAAMVPVRLPAPIGVVAVVLTTLLLINGVNLIDGLDALAGGVGLVCAAGFAFVFDGDNRAMALALAGGLGGFLCFNRPPAKVYMGDGGAYVVGTTLALLLCLAWAPEETLAVSLGSLLLVACPVAEVGCSVLRRARTRTGVFAGDRGHGYDRLVSRGWPRNKAVGAYVGAQAVLAATAVGAVHLRPVFAGAIAAACAVLLLWVSAALGFITAGHPEATQ